MLPEYDHCDLRTLQEFYMRESREFSIALEQGASWKILQQKRQSIREINEMITKKYDEIYRSSRNRFSHPHG
ncbi:MAG TPA: hypothetical protein VFQ73_05600 [Flavisolibacter sp.]|nr:hypothetical protein [Flavisolibacter sp.]